MVSAQLCGDISCQGTVQQAVHMQHTCSHTSTGTSTSAHPPIHLSVMPAGTTAQVVVQGTRWQCVLPVCPGGPAALAGRSTPHGQIGPGGAMQGQRCRAYIHGESGGVQGLGWVGCGGDIAQKQEGLGGG